MKHTRSAGNPALLLIITLFASFGYGSKSSIAWRAFKRGLSSGALDASGNRVDGSNKGSIDLSDFRGICDTDPVPCRISTRNK